MRKINKQLPQGHIIKLWDESKNLFIYIAGNNRCMFLNEENQCSIYTQRPLVCRMYPVLWKKSENPGHNIFIDLSCPYAHVKPMKELVEWTKKPKNVKEMKKMGSLDFDGRKGQYLSYKYLKSNFDDLTIIYEEN